MRSTQRSIVRHLPWFVVATAGVLAAAACQSTSSSDGTAAGGSAGAGAGGSAGSGAGGAGAGGAGGSGGDGTGGSAGSGGSAGGGNACAFTVAARMEYQGWESPAPQDTTATPNISRVRLGLGGNITLGQAGYADPSTSIGIAWQTDVGVKASMVQWGESPDPSTWPATNVVNGNTWVTPGLLRPEQMHEAYICGLTPAKTYYYRVGGGPTGQEQWSSDVYSFTTTPSDPNATVTLALTGDSRGEQNNAWQIQQARILSKGVAMQLFSGDMINLAPDQNEWEEWIDRAWKDATGKPSALGQILTLAAHGNHDNHNVLFYGNLTLPQDNTNPSYAKFGELFYSVNVGAAHVIVLDDLWLISTAGDQSYKPTFDAWVKADLAAAQADRANHPWIIAVHHHPEYSSSAHGQDSDVLRGRAYFEPIWSQYNVDLVVNGHDHDYERSKPISGDPNNPTFGTGTTYLVCAGAGAEGYNNGTNSFTAKSATYDGTTTLGTYGLLEVSKTSLHLTAHFLTADGTDPVIEDTTLTK